jgi:hypothetical protein
MPPISDKEQFLEAYNRILKIGGSTRFIKAKDGTLYYSESHWMRHDHLARKEGLTDKPSDAGFLNAYQKPQLFLMQGESVTLNVGYDEQERDDSFGRMKTLSEGTGISVERR